MIDFERINPLEDILDAKDAGLDNIIKEIPEFHLEGLNDQEKRSIADISRAVFENEVLKHQGLLGEWEEIDGSLANSERFSAAYRQYLFDGATLKEDSPEKYNFMRDRLFYGKEFLLQSTEIGSIVDTPEIINEGVSALVRIKELRPEVWEQLSEYERAMVMSDLTRTMADIMKVPVHNAIFEQMPSYNCNGYYSNDGYIHLNNKFLSQPELLHLAVNTIIHELRHSYQYEAIRNPQAYGEDIDTIVAWRQNKENYISPEYDYRGYWYQPLEVDAREVAETIVDKWRVAIA